MHLVFSSLLRVVHQSRRAAGAGLEPERFEVARLARFDITIRPLANLVGSETGSVYGVLATTTHAELERLYRHARDELGGVYLPYPVVVQPVAGVAEPALCYIAPAPPDPDYVRRIVAPARELAFPAWYLERVESFLA